MNGAELPCGTPIQVQPSDPLYKLKKKQNKDDYYGSASLTQDNQTTPEETNEVVRDNDVETPAEVTNVTENRPELPATDGGPKEGADDDLDDFFASLE